MVPLTALALTDLRSATGTAVPERVRGSRSLGLEVLFVLVLVYSTTAFLPMLRPAATEAETGDQLIQLIWLPLYAAVCLVLLHASREHEVKIRIPVGMITFAVLGLASETWSQSPTVTVRRVLALCLTLTTGCAMAIVFTPATALRLVRVALIITAVGSLALIVLAPGLAHDELVTGTYRGAFYQKNVLGRMMAAGLVIEVLSAVVLSRRLRAGHIAAVALYGLLLVLSDSATSILVVLGVVPMLLFASLTRTVHGRRTLSVLVPLALGATVLLIALAGSVLRLVTQSFSKDPTLSNRTLLWAVLRELAHGHEWRGFGYGSFWLGDTGRSGVVREYFDYPFVHAHQGFLDVWLQLGWLGLGLTCLLFVLAASRSVRALGDAASHRRALIALALLVLVVALNLDEGPLLGQNATLTILFAYAQALSLQLPRRPATRRSTATSPASPVERRW